MDVLIEAYLAFINTVYSPFFSYLNGDLRTVHNIFILITSYREQVQLRIIRKKYHMRPENLYCLF